ncbi:restriction endonuclease [Embleya sp. NPDC008237]|uniref:restriction endonuclease n=1 Tax=Embleya sp. NPDC008237 TaxID=3363978 RepID=UPI0036F14711
MATALDELEAAKQRMGKWQEEADELLRSVFLDPSAAEARERITGSGRTLRLRVEAASLLDDFGYTVRTRFPYPVALRWREAQARLSAGEHTLAYEAVLDTAEILLCYSALLVAALAREEGIELGELSAVRDKFRTGRGGPGFGEWAALLGEISGSRKRRGLAAEHPLNDLGALLSDTRATRARQRLSGRRNDQAHLRRVDPVDLPQALQEAFTDLTTLMEEARFLADWPLVHVTAVRWDALRGSARVDYRELTGDHPVVPTSTMTHDGNDLEVGSLYLRDREHRLHLLRPFLVGRNCPVCRSWSTFHVDKVVAGVASLKSLEHGHTTDDPETGDALRHVGLL